MPDLFHVALLAGNALILTATCAACARTAYHARLARTAASLARADRADARHYADRADRAADRACGGPRAPAADPAPYPAPVILPFDTAPVFVPGGPRDADGHTGA